MVDGTDETYTVMTRSHSNLPPSSASRYGFSPKLPPELCTMIWRLTLEPRVIELTLSDDGEFMDSRSQQNKWSRRQYTLAALYVCKESRNCVLSLYPLCFKSPTSPASTPFNSSIDTLYLAVSTGLRPHHIDYLLGLPELQQIQHLAIEFLCLNPAVRVNDQIYKRHISATYWHSDDTDLAKEADLFYATFRSAVDCLKELKELLIVYPLKYMQRSTVTDGKRRHLYFEDDQPYTFFDEFPDVVKDSEVEIQPLPASLAREGSEFNLWKVASCRVVYGWRYPMKSPLFVVRRLTAREHVWHTSSGRSADDNPEKERPYGVRRRRFEN